MVPGTRECATKGTGTEEGRGSTEKKEATGRSTAVTNKTGNPWKACHTGGGLPPEPKKLAKAKHEEKEILENTKPPPTRNKFVKPAKSYEEMELKKTENQKSR